MVSVGHARYLHFTSILHLLKTHTVADDLSLKSKGTLSLKDLLQPHSSCSLASTILSSLFPSITPPTLGAPQQGQLDFVSVTCVSRTLPSSLSTSRYSRDFWALRRQASAMKMESTFWLSLGSLADVSKSSMLWASANFSAVLEGTWGNHQCLAVRLGTPILTNAHCNWGLSQPYLYLVDEIALVSHQDSRNRCRHPVAVALLEHKKSFDYLDAQNLYNLNNILLVRESIFRWWPA